MAGPQAGGLSPVGFRQEFANRVQGLGVGQGIGARGAADGALIDQHNLVWLMRYRLNYGLSASETYYLLVPFGRQLHQDRLKTLVNLNSFEQMIEALPKRLYELLQDAKDPLQAEHFMYRDTADFAHKNLRFSPSAVTRALAYMVPREMDLKRIYAILQGKVLDLDVSLIRMAAGIGDMKGAASTTTGGAYV